jgi:uncharacterized membrane protein
MRTISDNLFGLFVLGLIMGLLIFFQFTALKHMLVSYVIAFKRAGVLVSVLLGVAFFGEKSPVKNLFCTAMMVLGLFLLIP